MSGVAGASAGTYLLRAGGKCVRTGADAAVCGAAGRGRRAGEAMEDRVAPACAEFRRSDGTCGIRTYVSAPLTGSQSLGTDARDGDAGEIRGGSDEGCACSAVPSIRTIYRETSRHRTRCAGSLVFLKSIEKRLGGDEGQAADRAGRWH